MTEPVRLIVAMEDDLLIVDERDHSRARTELSRLAPQCLAADLHHPGRLYCGTSDHGLWRSDDTGDSWHRVSGLNAQQVTSVAVSAQEVEGEFGAVFVGTEPSAIFRSNDGASTWHECAGLDRLPSASTWSFPPRPETHHVRWISLDPAVRGRLFVAIEAGALIHSLDGGTTWRDRVRGGPYDTHTLVSASRDSNHLYVAAGDGYFESDDGGATWRKPQAGLQHRYLWSVAIDLSDADRDRVWFARPVVGARRSKCGVLLIQPVKGPRLGSYACGPATPNGNDDQYCACPPGSVRHLLRGQQLRDLPF